MKNITPRASGFQIRYQRYGQEIDVFVATKAEAELTLARAKIDMAEGSFISPKKMSTPFGKFVAEVYLPSRTRIKESSRERESWVIDRAVTAWGERPLVRIQRPDVSTFLTKGSAGSRVREKGVLRVLFGLAVREGYLHHNPVVGVEIPDPVKKRRKEYPDADQVRAIIDQMDESYRAMVALMSYAGLRIGEAAAMTRDCIGSDYIEIRATVYEPNRGQPMLTPPKTSGSETEVEIPSSLRRMLLEHAVRYGMSSDSLLFPGNRGGILRLRNWRRRQWADACRGAGVVFKPHDLRHFYCSLLIQQGASVERVCRLARHTNPRITWETYTHEFKRAKGHISPEMAALDRMIGG